MGPKKKSKKKPEPRIAISLKISPKLNKRIRDLAKKEHRSLNSQIIHMLSNCIDGN
jgi:hypothetical protein